MITAITGSALILVIIILYLLLVLGYPYGEYAMGGQNKVLPPKMKVTAAIAIILQVIILIVLLEAGNILNTGLPSQVVSIAGYIFAAYLSVNIVMNLMSKSRKERMVMTPLSAIAAVCYWITL